MAFLNTELPRVDRNKRRFDTFEEAEQTFQMSLPLALRELFKQPLIPQRTEDWFLARAEAITGSDFATAIDCNPYESKANLIRKKVNNVDEFHGNRATEHGAFYEDVALHEYEKRTGFITFDFGLMASTSLFADIPEDLRLTNEGKLEWFHRLHKNNEHADALWLKASPDGVAFNPKTGELVLVEIKCPYSNWFPGQIMCYYYPQVQLMMELMNLETCHFVQYAPPEGQLIDMKFDLLVVKRNREWMNLARQEAAITWSVILRQRRNELCTQPVQYSSQLVPQIKALFPEYVLTPNKKKKYTPMPEEDKEENVDFVGAYAGGGRIPHGTFTDDNAFKDE